MEQVALDVPEMESPECERAVTTALINVPGVHWATAAADAGVVTARFDPEVATVDLLREALETTGFESPTPASE